MENENRMERVITFGDFFAVLKRCFFFIICAALIAGVGAGMFAEFVMTKQYAVTLKFKVVAVDTSGSSGQNLSVNMVTDVIELLRDDTDLAKLVLAKITTKNDKGQTVGVADSPENITVLQNSMRLAKVSGSSVFTVTITSTDPDAAFSMAAALAEVAPSFFAESEKVSFGTNGAEKGGLKLVRGAEMAKSNYMNPIAPNVPMIAVIGAVLGAVCCYAIFFLLYVFDTTIRTEEDLKKVCECPVLGSIPSIAAEKASARKRGEVKRNV